jgi:glycosyltransferase involved in cell wall biosynthesis
MRIGIDARELCGRATGVGRYLGGLLTEWQTGNHAHQFVLYAPTPLAVTLDARRFLTRHVAGRGGTWWEQMRLPRLISGDHLDVWFAPAYTAPLRLAIPAVVAIHDLSFIAHPEWFSLREGARRRWLVRRTAAKAAAVITISQFSSRELQDRLGVPAAKISVIPPGIGDAMAAREPRAPGHATAVPPPAAPHRILYVGSVFNRRHVVDLVRAFGAVARSRSDVALDIVGDNRSYPREDVGAAITAEGLGDRVRWHQYVSDEQLRDLYAGARAFAFLSEYEGLGLTPLEALSNGVPPVLLDTPVARESCGDAAIYVPLGNLAAITNGLEAALFDDATRARVLRSAAAALGKYNWRRAAADTLAVLERAAR